MYEIYVLSHRGDELSDPPSAVFDAVGGTIGRADDCTLVLPDAERLVSRIQATVQVIDGRLLVANVGAANRLQVNGRDLGVGDEVQVRGGDELRMGPYLLGVRDRRNFAETTIGPSDRVNRRR